ncbi:MAG: MFS transporter [Chloroflexi bacterium]|nr:MFS transporter [Chloroflexota bacterium]
MKPLIALWAIGLGTALSLMGDAALYAVLPTHTSDAGIALASVGLILSVNRFIRLATNGVIGSLYDRWHDRHAIFIASLWIGVASTALYALTFGLAPMLAARLLWGLAWSGIWVGGNAIVLEAAPEAERGRWVGAYQMWFFFGSALGTFTGGVLTDAFGYRNALWIGASVSALGALAAAFGLPHTQAQRLARSSHASWWRDWLTIPPTMWSAICAHGVNRLVGAGVLSATMGLVVQQNLGGATVGIATLTGGLLASRTFISLIGAPIAGALSDRAKNRWGILAFSLTVSAVGIALLGIPGLVLLFIAMIVSSATSGAIQSLATTIIGDLSDRAHYGKNMGALHTAGDLGSAIGPLAAYALLPITGLSPIFFACAALMLASAVWAGWMGKR